MDSVCSESMAQEMRLEDNWLSLTVLKYHPMHEKTHTCMDRTVSQVLIVVLKQIGSLNLLKAVFSVVTGIEWDTRQRLS